MEFEKALNRLLFMTPSLKGSLSNKLKVPSRSFMVVMWTAVYSKKNKEMVLCTRV